MRPLIVIGATGQLARAIHHFDENVILLGRNVVDLSHPSKVTEILEEYNPKAVINAAAYTNVDKAEIEEKLAHIINADAPTAMAIYCAQKNIPFIHFSTDYVFSGKGEEAWKENDIPCPLNAYGRSKLAGEEAIAHIGGKYMIFRTSWLYDARGKNFLNTIIRLAFEREELSIINDQFGAPTFAGNLAEKSLEALAKAMEMEEFSSGIYHLCNEGVTSWFGFASAIFEHIKQNSKAIKLQKIHAIPATDYPLPAKRPYNSRLDCSKIEEIFNIKMPHWKKALTECLESRNESN
ncbi:MAG: dTDP-4-dehydrorhamnose reductase [Pseudomonadota bacterium]